MKIFYPRRLRDAYTYADSGGQCLHLMDHSGGCYPNAPSCFKRAKRFAHLIDHDYDRLISTARRLGVRNVVVSRIGKRGQHVDLCGKPLERALKESVE